jgi:excisionase family DNA binding protein
VSVQFLIEYVGISKTLAYRLVREVTIPSVRFENRVLIPRDELITFMEGQTTFDQGGMMTTANDTPRKIS